MKKQRPITSLTILVIFCLECSFAQILFEESSNALEVISVSSVPEGTGVSFFDFDNDGWDDITFPTQEGIPILFYKNTGSGFEPIELIDDDPLYATKQTVWVDIDNDGDYDLFVASENFPNKLYENEAGTLSDITEEAGLPLEVLRSNSGNWGDYNNDGFLDLYIANRDIEFLIPNMLFKNNGDGTFTNVNAESLIGDVAEFSFQGTFFDYNNDNYVDLYVINDRSVTQNILYKNNGDGTFIDVSASSNTNFPMDAMSIAVEDVDSNGFLDVYITNIYVEGVAIEGNVYLENDTGSFMNKALERGIRFDNWSWGAVWLDGDNDSDLDLYVSGAPAINTATINSAAFYLNDGSSSFNEVNDSGFEDDLANSFGNAVGDYNNDGFPDMVVANNFGYQSYVWQNKTDLINNNNWFKIKVQGVESNRDGIGARIELVTDGQKQYRAVLCGEGYLSQNSQYEHFGIGNNTLIDQLKITWPSGQVDEYTDLQVNQTVTAIEGAGVLSLASVPVDDKISIYPNPAEDRVYLSLPTEGTLAISVYTASGQLIASELVLYNAEDRSFDVSNWASGVYFIHLEASQSVQIKRLIIR